MIGSNNRYFLNNSYVQRKPRKTYRLSLCLICVGSFLFFLGFMFTFSRDTSPRKPPFDDPFFNRESKGPESIGAVLLLVGSLLIIMSLIGFVTSYVVYRKDQREQRLAMLSIASTLPNPQTFSPLTGDYPPQTEYQYPAGYQAVTQTVVYNPTTQPNHPIGWTVS